MSLAKYRVFDLSLITIVGVVTEILGCYLINLFMPTVIPVIVASLIIIYMATMRWGWWGLIEIPIMAITTYIAVLFVIPYHEVNDNYVQINQNFWSILIFDISGGLWSLIKWQNDKRSNRLLNSIPKRIGFTILIYLVGTILNSLFLVIYHYHFLQTLIRTLVGQMMALVITIIVIEILKGFNAANDVKKDMLTKKKEMEFEKGYYENKKE